MRKFFGHHLSFLKKNIKCIVNSVCLSRLSHKGQNKNNPPPLIVNNKIRNLVPLSPVERVFLNCSYAKITQFFLEAVFFLIMFTYKWLLFYLDIVNVFFIFLLRIQILGKKNSAQKMCTNTCKSASHRGKNMQKSQQIKSKTWNFQSAHLNYMRKAS